MNVYENDSIIMYGCDDGFTIKNDEQRCVDGEWLGENPQCISSKYIDQNEINTPVRHISYDIWHYPVQPLLLRM